MEILSSAMAMMMMMMQKEHLDYVLVPLGLMVFMLYHAWLLYSIQCNSLRTVIGLNAESRHQWVLAMMSDPMKNGVLAIQTLRNNMMASTTLATAAITLTSLIGIFASKDSDDPISSTKRISITICFLVAFLCNVQSIRYYAHVSFLITAPTLRDKEKYIEHIAKTLNLGSHAWSLGLRAFYLSFSFFLWIYGAVPMFCCCCFTSFILYFLDTTSKITKDIDNNLFKKESGTNNHDAEAALEPDYYPLAGDNVCQNTSLDNV